MCVSVCVCGGVMIGGNGIQDGESTIQPRVRIQIVSVQPISYAQDCAEILADISVDAD